MATRLETMEEVRAYRRTILADPSRLAGAFYPEMLFKLAGLSDGDFAFPVDQPSEEVSNFLRFFGTEGDMQLRENTKLIARSVFSSRGRGDLGDKVVFALDFIDQVTLGTPHRDTGEPTTCHIYRSLLHYFAALGIAQECSHPNLKPYDSNNLEDTFIAALALIFHDVFEDNIIYELSVSGPMILVLEDDTKLFGVEVPTKEGAEYFQKMIDAYTLYDPVDPSQQGSVQVRQILQAFPDNVESSSSREELRKCLAYLNKVCDRCDNLDTRWDRKPEEDEAQVARRVRKFEETLGDFGTIDLAVWNWMYGSVIDDEGFISIRRHLWREQLYAC